MDAELTREIKELVYDLGGDICGVADLTPINDHIEQKYGHRFKDFHRAVSIGVYFPVSVVNELVEGPSHTYMHYYRVVNVLIDEIALKVSTLLHKKGHKNFPIPSSQRVTEDKLGGIFSHRMAAYQAGLGWIGKNANLVNPEVGPRLRIITVLTDAPLVADKPIENRCGECQACEEICPPNAIKGKKFNFLEARDEKVDHRIDAAKCDQYQTEVRKSFGKRVCGKCLAVCPWGS